MKIEDVTVTKRDGTREPFNECKVRRAAAMAVLEVDGEVDRESIDEVVGGVILSLAHSTRTEVSVEDIQDLAIDAIEESSTISPGVAEAFREYRDERQQVRDQQMHPDATELSKYIHRSKYARRTQEGTLESFEETIARVCHMHIERFCPDVHWVDGNGAVWDVSQPNIVLVADLCDRLAGPEDEVETGRMILNAFGLVREKKLLPSMRSMHFAGPKIREHNACLYNCSATHVNRPRVFQEALYLLLAGCGVGYSVQYQHVEQLPALVHGKRDVLHYQVEDTIEGWADCIGALMMSYFGHGKFVEFDYSRIRPEGSPLRSSGGIAPGHRPLRDAVEDIRRMLDPARGRKLRPIECHDILCRMAECVLSGGVRRSSLIALFSPEDGEMMRAKTAENFRPATAFDPGLNPQRAMANNSAVFLRDTVTRADFDRLMRLADQYYGEPGFFFTDDADFATNPCAEISLIPYGWRNKVTGEFYRHDQACESEEVARVTGFQMCNLTEINVAACETDADFLDACEAAAIIGTLQAAYTQFDYLGQDTQDITAAEALIGTGLTGMCDNPDVGFNPELLQQGAAIVVNANRKLAARLGIQPAARCTTVKPSGTASLELGGVASGIHPHHWERYIRTVTANPNEPIAKFVREHNPHAVKVKPNGDWAIEFPTCAPEGATTLQEMTGLDFVEKVRLVFDNWIVPGASRRDRDAGRSHNISATCTIHPGEDKDVRDAVWDAIRSRSVQAMSFAPWTLDTNFPFAPRLAVRTAVEESRFRELCSRWTAVPWDELKVDAVEMPSRTQTVACAGGACELL